MKPIGETSLKALGDIAEDRQRCGLAMIDAASNEPDPEQRARLQWEAIAELTAANRLRELHRDHSFICQVLAQQGDLARRRMGGFE